MGSIDCAGPDDWPGWEAACFPVSSDRATLSSHSAVCSDTAVPPVEFADGADEAGVCAAWQHGLIVEIIVSRRARIGDFMDQGAQAEWLSYVFTMR